MSNTTIAIILFSAVMLFLANGIVRKSGLDDAPSTTRGDFGLGTLFKVGVYFVIWVLPTLVAYTLHGLLQAWGVLS